MAIIPKVVFDTDNDTVLGNANIPGHSGVATHALVCMLSGMSSRWKQAVGYFFTENSTDCAIFKPIILEIIHKAKSIGFHVFYCSK
jgi:hypothetical protein